MSKVVILHGTKGSPEDNWFPWLASQLREQGHDVKVPKLPTPSGQSFEAWLRAFKSQIAGLDRNSTVIGHSLGAVFLLRLLERATTPIKNAIFVAGFTGELGIPEYDALNRTFVEKTFLWPKIKKAASRFLCISGNDDPYVPVEQGQEIADNLGAEHVIVSGGGHLNAEFGFAEFPLLMEKITVLGL